MFASVRIYVILGLIEAQSFFCIQKKEQKKSPGKKETSSKNIFDTTKKKESIKNDMTNEKKDDDKNKVSQIRFLYSRFGEILLQILST